ncbi:MAG TPA: DoxX family protein [Gaiellaceae bacterium]
MSYGLLLLRIVVGGTMFAHGAQKLFGWFGGGGPRGTAGFFGNFGFRAPLLMAVAAGLAESGGLLFAAGLVTPLAALGIAIVMLNAIGLVHWPKGFFNANGGYEFPLTLLTVAVAVSAIGPGRFSVDRAIGWDDNISGVWWGVGVAVAAVAVTLVTLTLARRRERLHAAPAA